MPECNWELADRWSAQMVIPWDKVKAVLGNLHDIHDHIRVPIKLQTRLVNGATDYTRSETERCVKNVTFRQQGDSWTWSFMHEQCLKRSPQTLQNSFQSARELAPPNSHGPFHKVARGQGTLTVTAILVTNFIFISNFKSETSALSQAAWQQLSIVDIPLLPGSDPCRVAFTSRQPPTLDC
jgi:hypothetical protein